MKDQIIKIMESEGLTPAKFADEIGVQRSSISHIMSDRNKPSYDFILKVLERFQGINAEWLLTGKGSMIKSSYSQQEAHGRQKTLFDQPAENKVIDEQTKKKYTDTIHQKPAGKNIIETNSMPSINSDIEINKILRKEEITYVNKIKMIMLFYSNNTFEQFTPKD